MLQRFVDQLPEFMTIFYMLGMACTAFFHIKGEKGGVAIAGTITIFLSISVGVANVAVGRIHLGMIYSANSMFVIFMVLMYLNLIQINKEEIQRLKAKWKERMVNC